MLFLKVNYLAVVCLMLLLPLAATSRAQAVDPNAAGNKGPKMPLASEPDPAVQTRFRIEGNIKVGGDCKLGMDIWTADGTALDVNLSAEDGVAVVGNATATIQTERRQWTTTVFAMTVLQQGVHKIKIECSPVRGAARRWCVVRTLILDTEAGLVRSPMPELLSGPLTEVRSELRSAGTAVGRTRDVAHPENSVAPKKDEEGRGIGIERETFVPRCVSPPKRNTVLPPVGKSEQATDETSSLAASEEADNE